MLTVDKFYSHLELFQRQATVYIFWRHYRESLECLVVMDFTENYYFVMQDEVQSFN